MLHFALGNMLVEQLRLLLNSVSTSVVPVVLLGKKYRSLNASITSPD
ncbi:hypothetical protein [Roseateles sp. DC23W]